MRTLLMVCTLLHTACATELTVMGDAVGHARTVLQTMVREQELPGAQYVAVTADRTLLALSVGVADAATQRPMDSDTQLMAYSITKALTAIAVLQLSERGSVSLDEPASAHYAEHPYGDAVTVRMLLAHTAGVPNPLPLDWFALGDEPLDREAKLRALLVDNAALEAIPGEEYRYSNVGYWLLERVIEAASGADYARYMQEHVFDPVGVSPAQAGFELPPLDRAAIGHSRRMAPMNLLLWAMSPSRYWDRASGGWSRIKPVVPHGRAYGGLYCTAFALSRVLQDLLQDTPRLLSTNARDAMLTEQRTLAGESTAASLGWLVGELEGVRYFGKQGGGLGFHGNVRVYSDLGLATVLLANRTEISPGPIDARSDQLDLGFVRERRGQP